MKDRPPLGILMLDTRFPRIVGDIGNPASFEFPVIYRTLEGVGPADAVAARPDRTRIESALASNARKLAEAGAVGISTSCGFLALFQRELAAVSPVPVATSALLMIATLAPRRVGVITASARNLTAAHFAAVGAPVDTPVEGMPERGAFAATFLAMAWRSTATPWSTRPSRRAGRCWRATRSMPSFSNAPTCRPTPRPCGPRCRCPYST